VKVERVWQKSIIVLSAVPVLMLGMTSAVAGAPVTQQQLRIEAVSNPRPDLVSGGQVLLRIAPAADDVRVNGHDATAAFAAQSDGSLLGLVSGLRDGANIVSATDGGQHATLLVRNHPITGPVFSGHQQVPFFCETQVFGLAPSVQPLCSAPTQVSYRYRTTAGTFAALADPASRPADLASAVVGGRSVPYIVRIERGTIDRAVYEIAALYDGSDPSPLHADTSWNDRLVYTFGGGCNAGYHQGRSTGGVLNDLFLAQGYAVASSSLNVLDNNCSPIISAEAAMMVKEHFVETYGPVAHTIGWGGSGGAIQQYDIAENYPGIVDGIVPGVSFPDPLSTAGPRPWPASSTTRRACRGTRRSPAARRPPTVATRRYPLPSGGIRSRTPTASSATPTSNWSTSSGATREPDSCAASSTTPASSTDFPLWRPGS
jgi:hypothetical protein